MVPPECAGGLVRASTTSPGSCRPFGGTVLRAAHGHDTAPQPALAASPVEPGGPDRARHVRLEPPSRDPALGLVAVRPADRDRSRPGQRRADRQAVVRDRLGRRPPQRQAAPQGDDDRGRRRPRGRRALGAPAAARRAGPIREGDPARDDQRSRRTGRASPGACDPGRGFVTHGRGRRPHPSVGVREFGPPALGWPDQGA